MKVAVVTPRYGEHILGGAETMARRFGEELARRGHVVHAYTTGATNHGDLRNDLPAGVATINGVRVERFGLLPIGNRLSHDALLQRILWGVRTTVHEQFAWIGAGAHSPGMYAALESQSPHYDLALLIPYPFPLIHYAAACTRCPAVIWPCLHDEGYAYTEPVRMLLATSAGVQLNSLPEREFMEQRLRVHHPRAHVVGYGVDPVRADAAAFRAKFGIADPFVLYSGRIEVPKNVNVLVDFFKRHKIDHPGPLKLVLMGAGTGVDTDHPDVITLGFQTGADKQNAYAAATLLCQPSINESFSIVIMESWQAEVPVLVHAQCAVTRHHVERSNGGLIFATYADFSQALRTLTVNSELARAMGARGRDYVAREYNWNTVLAKFERAAEDWIGAGMIAARAT